MIATISSLDFQGLGAAVLLIAAAALAWSTWRKPSSSSSPAPAPSSSPPPPPVPIAAAASPATDKLADGFEALRTLDAIYKGLGVFEEDRRDRMVDGLRNIFSANETPPSPTP
jgi:hypothetical protein